MIEVTNLKALDLNFKQIGDLIGVKPVLVQKKLAFDIFSGIVADTPIDKGRAMNNWNISVGVLDTSITEEGGQSAGIQGAKEGEAISAMASVRLGSTVWISNSLSYIVFLNEGSSDQAPKNFVERNIINNVNSLKVLL